MEKRVRVAVNVCGDVTILEFDSQEQAAAFIDGFSYSCNEYCSAITESEARQDPEWYGREIAALDEAP